MPKASLTCCAADNKLGAYNASLYFIHWGNALNLINQHVRGFPSYIYSPLLYSGKRRVACNGPLAVCKAADAYIFGNAESEVLRRIKHAYGRIVVYAEKGIRGVELLSSSGVISSAN